MSVSITSLIMRRLISIVLVAMLFASTAIAGIMIPAHTEPLRPDMHPQVREGDGTSLGISRDESTIAFRTDFRVINPINGTTVDCSDDGKIPVEVLYNSVGPENFTLFLIRPKKSLNWEVSKIQNNNQLYRPENIMLIKYINVIRPGNYTIAIVTTNEKIDVGTTLSDIPGHEAIHIITVTVPPPSKTDIHIVSPVNGTVIESVETKNIPIEIYYNTIGAENITATLIYSYETDKYNVVDIRTNHPSYNPQFYSTHIPILESGTYNIVVITTNMQLSVGDTYDTIPIYRSIDEVVITSLAYPHVFSLFLRKELLYIILTIFGGVAAGIFLFRFVSNISNHKRR